MGVRKRTESPTKSHHRSIQTQEDADNFDESELYRDADVAVSGMSCRLPQARNMKEFVQNLYSTTDLNINGPAEQNGVW